MPSVSSSVMCIGVLPVLVSSTKANAVVSSTNTSTVGSGPKVLGIVSGGVITPKISGRRNSGVAALLLTIKTSFMALGVFVSKVSSIIKTPLGGNMALASEKGASFSSANISEFS